MSRLKRVPAERSRGERGELFAYMVVALFGGGLGLLVVNRLNDGVVVNGLSNWYEAWIVVVSAIGAGLSLRYSADWLGVPGYRGALRALAGSLLVALVGSIIAGTLALPFYGTMFGPLILITTLIEAPFAAALWLWCLMVSHGLLAKSRIERDTLFAGIDAEDIPVYEREGPGSGLNP